MTGLATNPVEDNPVKMIAATIAASLLCFASVPAAWANSDDAAWIKRCVSDNSDQNQSDATIASYCSCMNNKMSSNETLSITAWEKTHPNEQEACSKESGWVSK
jgi:hypothetical protein